MASQEYKDPEWLERKYHDDQLSMYEIGDICDIETSTVRYWMKKHGIERRSRYEANSIATGSAGEPYHDEEWLRREYHDKGKAAYQIAEEQDVDASTIFNHLDRCGIEKRTLEESREIKREIHATGRDHGNWVERCTHYWHGGYETWQTSFNGEKHHVMVHRLAAVAWFGMDAVRDNHIHHKNGVPWDNREGNLGAMPQSEHSKHHFEQGDTLPHITRS